VSGFSRAKTRIDKCSGVSNWILHDARRTTRTALSRLGFEKHICDRVLGHATPDVSRHYDHWAYMPQKRAALEAWEMDLTRIIQGDAPKVLALR
jgi:hypothetical protein